MMWFLGLVLAVFVCGFVVVVGMAILRAIIDLMARLILAASAAIAVGVGAGVIAMQSGADGMTVGILVVLLAFLPALLVVGRWRNRTGKAMDAEPSHTVPGVELSPIPAKPIERTLFLRDADSLANAWDDALRMAPGEALGDDREICARFLASFEATADIDPAATDLATFIRRHVPGLVAETRAVVEGAERDEQCEAIAAMVANLRQVTGDARAALASRHVTARERLGARRIRFAMRAAERKGLQ